MSDSDVVMSDNSMEYSPQGSKMKADLGKVELKCMETQTLLNGVLIKRDNGVEEEIVKEVNGNEVCIHNSILKRYSLI